MELSRSGLAHAEPTIGEAFGDGRPVTAGRIKYYPVSQQTAMMSRARAGIGWLIA